MRILRIAIVLVLLVLIPFFLWGDKFMALLDGQAARDWLKNYGPLGWLVVIGLLVADLFLPIPGTAVMSAAGDLYGAWVGGVISVVGSALAGLLAYVLCRAFGRGAAGWLAGERGLAENEALFERSGAWLVMLSRWLPVLPEVVACLAGLARMKFRIFAGALLCGTVPMGFTYAAVGAMFDSEPAWALGLSVALPVVLWFGFRQFLRARQPDGTADS